MKFTNDSDPTASKDMDNDLSVTEKAIQDACNISCSLDASKDVPSINKWLIAEVSVLLLDSKKETCWLPYSSVTEGVWSLLGKRLELPTAEIEGTVERKHLKKKRQTSMRPVTVEQNDDDSGFQQLAFLAVKDATGISRSDLVVLEKHVVYSLTKEKTASCFYIMQCTQSISLDIQIPVKEIFESFLQGPLVKRNSGNWSTTDVVEYFHLLPYASIMSTFFLREISSLEGSNTRSHKDITDNCENEISESRISLFDQNSGNVSINDMYGRNANPADSFSAEVAANNGCERNTRDQEDLGKENDVHHHHETVRAYGSISGKAKEESANKRSKSIEEKIEKMEAKMPDESSEVLIGTNSDRINLEISEASASKGSKNIEEKIEKMEAKTPDESYEASIGAKSDHINLEISEAKDGDGCHEKVSDSAVALIGTKSDCINLEISEAKNGDGFHEKVSHSAVGLIGTKSDCINLEISEAKDGDGCHEKVSHSAVALIGTKSDRVKLEISEAKKGDGCHEKVSHSAAALIGTKSDCISEVKDGDCSHEKVSDSAVALIGNKSDCINLEISEAKDGDGCHEKVSHSAAALIGTKSDCINLEISEAKNGDGCHEKVSDSTAALIGTKSDRINLEIAEAKNGDSCNEKVSHSAFALIGTKSDCINLEISEAKNGDGCHEKVSDSAVALIGTKSDCINLEISEAKDGDGCHEKVSHSAVGQEATAVGGPHMIRKSEGAGSGSSIKNTKTVDFSSDKLTGVNVKCLNDTSNKVHGKNRRDYEDSTVKELHDIINHPRTTDELLKSTKSCEINDYTDMELAGAHLKPLEVKINDGYHSSSSPTRPQRMDIDAYIPCSKNGNNSKDCKLIKEVYHRQKKRTRESGGEIIGSGIICKAQRTDEGKADKERDLSTISPDQNGIFVAHAGFVHKPESMDIGYLQTVLASKEKALTKSSLQVLLHKRRKLCHQQRKIEYEIALCDESIQGVLDGGKDSLTVKLDTVLDFCDEICLEGRAAIQEDGHQPHEEFGLIQPLSGRKLSKAVRTP
ncbi:hypothetical protein HAX54_022696 [Datura stramonium]|uniref:Uncharacterized protein n=1 Tax=Datura stramonium TaxID=4076 RepID=A0ABS8UXR8_DATST|nr:hypothetical protein [Datura stramonium]